jgi:hypothetical protein
MGFASDQIEKLSDDMIFKLVDQAKFNARLLEFVVDKDTSKVRYLVLETPKEELKRLNNYTNDELVKIGYTKEQIDSLPEGFKLELIKDTNLGINLESFTGNISEVEYELDNTNKETGIKAVITSSQLSLTTSIIDYGTVNNLNTKRISATFNWLQNPYYRLTDKLGIAYGHPWSIDESRGGLVYQCYGESTGNLYTFYYYDGQYTPNTGVSYENINIRNVYMDEHTTNHSGWATLFIRHYVNQSGNNTRTDVLSKYYHKKLGLSSSLNLSPTPSISLSSYFDSYDYRENLIYFDWVQ